MKRCEAQKGDGSRCQGKAMEDYRWCYAHRPDLANERRRDASRGGKRGGRRCPGSAALGDGGFSTRPNTERGRVSIARFNRKRGKRDEVTQRGGVS